MGKKDNENYGKYGIKNRLQSESKPVQFSKKKRFSTKTKMFMVLALIAIIVVSISYSVMSQLQLNPSQIDNPSQIAQAYPRNASPVFYTNPVVSADGTKVTVPASFVNSSKLVSVDVKLQTPMSTLTYQDRTIPLTYYKNGEYLPLILISTPSGNTVVGIRTCEPCGSFSFHIAPGEILQCDACGTQWELEDFAPVSGGCLTYPPPKLTANISDNIEIDLSTLPVTLAA